MLLSRNELLSVRISSGDRKGWSIGDVPVMELRVRLIGFKTGVVILSGDEMEALKHYENVIFEAEENVPLKELL